MKHTFNIDIAEKHSIEKAILFENILHWSKKNKSNNKNIVDGKAWTYNTYDEYSDLFPYMKINTIKKALREMKNDGLIEARNDLNDNKWDKTNWYHASSIAENMHRQQKSPLIKNKNILSIANENDHHNSTDTNTDINNIVTPIGDDVSHKNVVPSDKEIKKMTQMLQVKHIAENITEHLIVQLEYSIEKFKRPTEAVKKKWAKDIEKLIRLDGNTPEEIKRVITWIHSGKGSFWITNIQSGKKLREKFPTLWTQMTNNYQKPVSSKNRILSEIGAGKVFYAYHDKSLDAAVHVCLYGDYNALYDFHRNKYVDKDKAVKVWELIDKNIDAILSTKKKERHS